MGRRISRYLIRVSSLLKREASENIYIDSSGFEVQDDAAFRAYVLPEEEGMYLYDATGNLVWDLLAFVGVVGGKERKDHQQTR